MCSEVHTLFPMDVVDAKTKVTFKQKCANSVVGGSPVCDHFNK